MPLLRGLTKDEMDAFLHKVRNTGRDIIDEGTSDILNEMTFNTIEQKLAKISEEENFNLKNRYRL